MTMKRTFFIAGMVLLAVNCQTEQPFVNETPSPSVAEQEFYAAIEGEGDSETKVYVDENLALLWNELDEISIFNKTTRMDRYFFKGKDGDNSGSFGKVAYGITEGQRKIDYNYAVYPYSEETRITEEGDISFTFPSEQHFRENSFGLGANTMVAISTDYRLVFRNVCGYICFKLYGDKVPVSSIEIHGNRGEKIAGKATIKASLGQEPGVVMASDKLATSSITLTCDEPVLIGADAEHFTPFWIAVPPVVFEEGITVTVNCSNGGFLRQRINSRIEIERSKVIWTTPKNVEQSITFSDTNFKAYCVANFDTNNDQNVSFEEALNVTSIDCSNLSIKSLEGIEHFSNLKILHCYGNQISSLDLSLNTHLTSLRCNSNQITGLDLSNNKELVDLLCEINPLTEVILPNTLTEIPKDAFYRCANLEHLDIPLSVTSIGNNAFANCVKLKAITLPASVTSIGTRAFYNCPELAEIWVSSMTPPTGGAEMFDVTNDCPIYLHQSASVNEFKKAEYWSIYKHRFQSIYFSTDYSADGQVHTLQAATIGNGINIVLMGDAYTDRLIADGTYRKDMAFAAEAFFSVEPYKSFRNYFNVYYVDVVSEREAYDYVGVKTFGDGIEVDAYYGKTALKTYVATAGRYISGGYNIIWNYVVNNFDFGNDFNETTVLVMMNKDVYGGICSFQVWENGDYGSGAAIAIFPLYFSKEEELRRIIIHEACGHGFAKLLDEYVEESLSSEVIPNEEIGKIRYKQAFGHNRNVDFSSDPNAVLWSHFLTDERYAGEGLGVFEGAATYGYGTYRPTSNSIMREHRLNDAFNAPSREAIYYRIHKLAFGPDWEYNYEDFVAYDAINRGKAANASRAASANYVEKQFEPLPPPIIVEGNTWEVKRK